VIRTENQLVEEDKVKIFHTKDEIVELGLTSMGSIKNTKRSKKFLFGAEDTDDSNDVYIPNINDPNASIFAKKRMHSKKNRKCDPLNNSQAGQSESPKFNFNFKDASKKNKR
jgi:hypothetical protein